MQVVILYGLKEDIYPTRSKREREELNTVKRILRKLKDKETLPFDDETEEVIRRGRYDKATIRAMRMTAITSRSKRNTRKSIQIKI